MQLERIIGEWRTREYGSSILDLLSKHSCRHNRSLQQRQHPQADTQTTSQQHASQSLSQLEDSQDGVARPSGAHLSPAARGDTSASLHSGRELSDESPVGDGAAVEGSAIRKLSGRSVLAVTSVAKGGVSTRKQGGGRSLADVSGNASQETSGSKGKRVLPSRFLSR